jgi:rubrerythrin
MMVMIVFELYAFYCKVCAYPVPVGGPVSQCPHCKQVYENHAYPAEKPIFVNKPIKA